MKKVLISFIIILIYVLSIFFMTTGLTGCTEGGQCNMTSCNATSCNGCGNVSSSTSTSPTVQEDDWET